MRTYCLNCFPFQLNLIFHLMDGYYWVDILELAIWCRPFISQNLSLFLISSFNFLISLLAAPLPTAHVAPLYPRWSQLSRLLLDTIVPRPRPPAPVITGQLSPATVDHWTRYTAIIGQHSELRSHTAAGADTEAVMSWVVCTPGDGWKRQQLPAAATRQQATCHMSGERPPLLPVRCVARTMYHRSFSDRKAGIMITFFGTT